MAKVKTEATIKILNWVTGSVIYESDKPTIKEAVSEANLRGADLRGADLYEANLYEADLREADLRGADLYGADLRGADLRGADLYEANLYEADLRGADLYEADLREADLYGADLYEADLREADLRGADLREADLYEADLRGADLRGADLDKLPTDYINQCSRDMLFVFQNLKAELPGLRKALVEGRINGTQYEGECACLIGTLAKLDGGISKVCQAIPFYEKGLHNPCEQWFWQIHTGDTPETNQFAAHAVKLIDMVKE